MQNSEQAGLGQSSTCPTCRATVPQANFNIHKTRCTANAYRRKKYAQKKAKQKQLKRQKNQRAQISVDSSNRPTAEREENEQLFPCHLCSHPQTMAELDTHFKVCRNRQITCAHCQHNFPSNLMSQHRAICQVRIARQRPMPPPPQPFRRPIQMPFITQSAARQLPRPIGPRIQSPSSGQQDSERSQSASRANNRSQDWRQFITQLSNNRSRLNSNGLFRNNLALQGRRLNSTLPSEIPPQASESTNSELYTPSNTANSRGIPRLIPHQPPMRIFGSPSPQFSQIRAISRAQRQQYYQRVTNQYRRLHSMLQGQIRAAAQRRDQANLGGLTQAQIQKIPNKIYKENKQNDKDTCCICYCDFQFMDQLKDLKCKHLFHVNCIKQWLKKNKLCPLCKVNTIQSIKQNQKLKPQVQKSRSASIVQSQIQHESRLQRDNPAHRRENLWRQQWFQEDDDEQESFSFRIGYLQDQ